MNEQEKDILENIEAETPKASIPEEIKPLKPITSEEWKKNVINERLLTLPSGITVKVKNVSFSKLICTGSIPLPLFNSLLEVNKKIQGLPQDQIVEKFSTDELKAMNEILSKFAVLAIVEPRVIYDAMPGNEDCILVEEIDFFDRMYIMTNCMSGNALKYREFFRSTSGGENT